ncbi:hypothetical protein MAR_010624 [Mya arenaria]|uniref:Uncharacterized protein n=1 Tax=Mya arenaria TaxID=6604 RepID=A0ABY7E688_MYAAR|nr:hypothetical protein MAR_010624 [Mya arenaria]
MAASRSLHCLPSDFGESFLPYLPTLRQRIQGRKYENESYFVSVNVFVEKMMQNELYKRQRIGRSKRMRSRILFIFRSGFTKSLMHTVLVKLAGGECAHVLGLVLKLTDWLTSGLQEVPSEPACTSKPQEWDRRKIIAEQVFSMIISRPVNEDRKKRPLTADITDNSYTIEKSIKLLDIEHLAAMRGTLLGYLASKPYKTVATSSGEQSAGSTLEHQTPLIQPTELPSAPPFHVVPEINNMDIVNDYQAKLSVVIVTLEESRHIEINTQGQADCELWLLERRKRITASKFVRIMKRKIPNYRKVLQQPKVTKAIYSDIYVLRHM